jgi:tetratricopeptide (TPR) repeat protein
MKLSKLKIIAFFGVLVLLLWSLYPRGIFLGYIYEGFSNLTKSEQYYLEYLKKNPTSKFAITRLTTLYERMGEPRKSLPYLEKLYEYRPRDEMLAMRYLDLLEDLNDDDALYKARLRVAKNLMALPSPPLQRITELLDLAYDYAEWGQLTDDQYAILSELIKVARNRHEYEWVIRHLDFNLKKTDKVVEALEEKLRKTPNDADALDELTAIYTMTGRFKAASDLINPRLAANPKNPDLLQARMVISDKTKNMPQLIQDAQTLLGLNVLSEEEEWDTKTTLAAAFQANHQNIEAFKLYEEILNHDRSDPDNWLNVVFVLESMGRYQDVVSLLEDYLAKFPLDHDRQKMLVEIYLYRLKDLSQVQRYRHYIQQNHDVEMALDVANMMVDRRRVSDAMHWLEDMHDLFPRNPDIVEMLAQLEAEQKNYVVAKAWYILLAQLQPNLKTQLEVGRELFFMGDAKLAEPYLKKVADADPQNVEALAWLSEIHAQLKQNKLALREARQALALGLDNPTLARQLRLRVALADQEWWVSMPILEEMLVQTPGDRYLKNDLRDLHRAHDTRLTPTFNFTKYGSEYFSLWGVKFKDFVTHRWELNADAHVGRFVSPSISFTGWTETGKVMLTSHHLKSWHFSLGVEGAGSGARTTVTPLLSLEYKPMPDTHLKLSGAYRQLRQDFPQAVAFGTLMDTIQIEGQTLLWNRLVLSAKYSAEYDSLPSGATATGNAIEPTASVILFRKPYVTLGWQMDYQRLNSTGNFLSSVPLIPYMNTQYVTGLISGRPLSQLLLEGGFYNGHDFDRGLSILDGDLWGVRGSFEWAALMWLDIYGSYEFGRQRLLDVPGYSNVVNFGISGHW